MRALVILAMLLGSSGLALGANATVPVRMSVDVAHPVGELAPIWRFFGADEPNYATSPTGQKLLLELGNLKSGEIYFRAHHLLTTGDGHPELKWGSTNVYTESHGAPRYDFALVDGIIDTYLARGIHPYIEIGFMPEALTSAPPGVPYRRPWRQGEDLTGLTTGWTYPPANFEKWRELVYQWTRHNIERYGRSEVQRWYFEVWNEPNLQYYWSGTPEDFYRLHDYAVDGVRRALPSARVGGPEVAGAGGAFMDGFLRHITTGTNFATGQIGTPTDFLSFHAKGQPTLMDGHIRMGIANQLKTIDEGFAKIAAVPALARKPVVIGENDPEGCAACAGPQNDYRNGSLYSTYTAASYARIWELARRHQIRLDAALTWAFTFDGQPWFAGYRQLATNGVDLPVLNLFRMFARLGPQQLAAQSDRQTPLDRVLAEGVSGSPDVGILATSSATGRLDVLIWNYQDDDVLGPTAAVHLDIRGLASGAVGRARVWRVGRSEGNAYAVWRKMGSPSHPTSEELGRLRRGGEMRWRELKLDVPGGKAPLSIERRLPSQTVELLEWNVE